MKNIIVWFVKTAARIHDKITGYNDTGYDMNDKQLHFFVFCAFTLLLFIAVQVLFRILAKKKVTAIAWLYTVTLDIGIMFAIEVGQGLLHTGDMELSDVSWGVWGMFAAIGIYILYRCIVSFSKILSTDPNDGYRNYSGDKRY